MKMTTYHHNTQHVHITIRSATLDTYFSSERINCKYVFFYSLDTLVTNLNVQ